METATIQMPDAKVTASFSDVSKKVLAGPDVDMSNVDVVITEAVKAAAEPQWKGIAVKAGIAAVVLGIAGGAYLLYRSYWKKPEEEVTTESVTESLRLKKETDPVVRGAKAEIIDQLLAKGVIDKARADDLKAA